MPRRPLSFETLAVSPFELHAGAIEALREDDVVRLVNTLIWDEGRRLGLPASAIQLTLRTRDPDGGIDALTDASNRESRYLGSGEMVWQFKKSWPDKERLGSIDLAAGAAREAFTRGAGYTLVVGQSMVPRTLRSRSEMLKGLAEEAGCRGPVQLFDAEHIARWTSSVPGAHLELAPSIRGYQRADRVPMKPCDVTCGKLSWASSCSRARDCPTLRRGSWRTGPGPSLAIRSRIEPDGMQVSGPSRTSQG